MWCLGVHLEGPFISREKKGAHDDSLIVPSLAGGMSDVTQVYGSLDSAAIVTLAPEVDGAIDVIRQLNSLGIIVSLGDLSIIHYVTGSICSPVFGFYLTGIIHNSILFLFFVLYILCKVKSSIRAFYSRR